MTALAVVIPARNEAELVGHAARAALVAMTHAERRRGVRTSLTIVLDSCTDESLMAVTQAVAGDPRVSILEVVSGSVGKSRAIGIDHALAEFGGDTEQTWITNSDADSTVPRDWCTSQLAHADSGADAVLGTVFPAQDTASGQLIAKWAAAYRAVNDHPHVHGANLGVRAAAYVAVGGFPHVTCDEDVLIVRALREQGHRVVAAADGSVATSFRGVGRAPNGFADYLTGLHETR